MLLDVCYAKTCELTLGVLTHHCDVGGPVSNSCEVGAVCFYGNVRLVIEGHLMSQHSDTYYSGVKGFAF